eukprot:TRINITY_DN61612_c0_g1_i1.p1 TRINITY_DN61612_c0_g1~~TRINITY_DN61612_c0_g1_i1.p1  ORF type:complete len:1264 (+),score=225.38 TRINITY_DN61612_c0_g1_i1:180-3971(+)
MPPFSWDFEKHEVEFSVSIRAIFHPAVAAASVVLPWIDDTRISSGPFSGFEPELLAEDSAGRRWPGATRASTTKVIGKLPVSMELVRQLQHRCLPISVYPTGDEVAGQTCSSSARVHLGPLLVASNADVVEAEDFDESDHTLTVVPGMETTMRKRSGRRPQPSEVTASWTETIGLAGLYSLELNVSTDVPLLTQEMLERLLPICFTVETVKGLPKASEALSRQFEDIFLEIFPKTTAVTEALLEECPRSRTATRPHNSGIRFSEPRVWLLGLVSLHLVREWLQHQGLVVEIHDQETRARTRESVDEGEGEGDEAVGEEEEDPARKKKGSKVVCPHGAAFFPLGPLLESRSLVLPLRGDIIPGRGNKKQRRQETVSETLSAGGLLEEEGQQRMEDRTAEGKREDTTDYHALGTVCTIRAVLALPIPDAPTIQARDEAEQHQLWEGNEVQDGESNIWKAVADESAEPNLKPLPFRAKVTPASGEAIVGPWRRHRKDAEEDEQRLQESLQAAIDNEDVEPETVPRALAGEFASQPATGLHLRFEKYGRVLIILRDEDTPTIQRVLKHVRHQNCGTLGLDPGTFALETYRLTEEQRADSHLDLLTGFAVMDGSVRLMVIEGLRDGGLRSLTDEALPRNERPNSAVFRVLWHPDVGFSERLYLDFGPRLKTVKLRPKLTPLEKLASRSDLFTFAGNATPETVAGMEAPKLLMELKQARRQRLLRSDAAFPRVEHLVNLEIMYGGYLSDQEIWGMPTGTGHEESACRQRRHGAAPASRGGASSVTAELRNALEGDLGHEMLETSSSTMKGLRQSRKVRVDMNNTVFSDTVELRKSASAPNFLDTNIAKVKERSDENARVNDIFGKKKVREAPFLDGEEVYMYSGQKLNSAELQKSWMRAAMDPQQQERSWTYSPAYMSGDFDFTGADPPGKTQHKPKCPNDSYSRLDNDTRGVFRNPPARPKEEFRKPARDISHTRSEDLKEPFVENEWHQLAVGVERRLPLAQHVRFDPHAVPHHRVISERPFDPSRVNNKGKDFGPRSMNDSVHYHGEGAKGEPRGADNERRNVREREDAAALRKGHATVRSFSQGASRECVTDLDRREAMLKDEPQGRKFRDDEPPRGAPSLRMAEEYHERGCPAAEFQARMRENDSSPPYDVATGTYMIRDPEVGQKRACMSGTLGRAPWRHGARGDTTAVPLGQLPGSKLDRTQAMQAVEYPSRADFDRTKPPPKSRNTESQLFKSSSRSAISKDDRKHAAYRRPVDYGVRIPG